MTSLPLISANQMLIWVLRISSRVRMHTYLNSLDEYPGTAIFKSFLILSKNYASTLPDPEILGPFFLCDFKSLTFFSIVGFFLVTFQSRRKITATPAN